MEFVDVIVDISHEKLDRVFQYRAPEELREKLQTGMQVEVPFGQGNRRVKAYVVGFSHETDYPVQKIKEISGIVKGGVKAESQLIALAGFLRERFGSTMNQALKTVLPVKRQIQEKRNRSLRLLISREDAEALLDTYRKKNYRAKARLLGALLDHGGSLDVRRAAGEYQITAAVIRGLATDGILEEASETVYRNPFAGYFTEQAEGPKLNAWQRTAADGIWSEYKAGKKQTFLLYGVTGSGKTEVYMELISRTLAEGRQAIVLIPEIALTYQTVMRFGRRFGGRVAVMHSRLSEGERYDQFAQAREGRIQVMVGPRSALFTPFPRLGMIILDEEHENSYKSENVPRYHAREAAVFRASLCGAAVVLGSATPSVDSFYRAEEGSYGFYRLPRRIGEALLPRVSIVDLRQELKEGNRSIFSRKLLVAMEDRLSRKQQIMLFINRRGLAGFVSCRSCGKAIRCPHCDVTLSLHGDGRLCCHYCGYEIRMPSRCPSCGSRYISGFRAGTQQIEQEIRRLFPKVRALRMDYDTTRTRESYERILGAFGKGEAEVLIGTQMIVKGHDFPGVTLVGVLAADISLYASDYRASERTFQLLTQAAGRAGRGAEAGEAVIQTYMPEHYSIQAAAAQDYEGFYRQEMAYRNLMGYPPAAFLLGIYLSGPEEAFLEERSRLLGARIREFGEPALEVVGPAPAALAKKNDQYRRVIYLKHKNEDVLLGVKKRLEKELEQDSLWEKLHVQFDFNPWNAY